MRTNEIKLYADADEIKENLRRLEIIKQQIFEAFADVKLEDGIGFYEAGAIDDRLPPTHADYIEEKARDEREDWTKLFAMLEKSENFDQARSCFMDAKGLHFYLPILLLLCDPIPNESVLMRGVIEKRPESIALMGLLTAAQKQSILDCLTDSVDYEASVAHYENFKGNECHQCGKIHYPVSYTKEEAIAEVEGKDEFILLQFLKDYFKQ
jgi:hypothetical protein